MDSLPERDNQVLRNAHERLWWENAHLHFHFQGLSEQSATNQVAQNNRNLFSHTLEARCPKSASLGGYQVVIRTTLPPEALEENPFFASSSFRWLPAFLGLGPRTLISVCCHTIFSSEISFTETFVTVSGVNLDNPGYFPNHEIN